MKKEITIGEKRLIAFFIDISILIIINLIIDSSSIYQKIYNINPQIISIIYFVIDIIAILCKDNLFKSGSLGKRIFGLGIFNTETNEYIDGKTKIKRNLMAFRFEGDRSIQSILNNHRNEDKKYNTKIDYIKRHK